jgi:hypothetical protein
VTEGELLDHLDAGDQRCCATAFVDAAESLYAPGTDEASRARGLLDAQRSSRGVWYRWGAPHVALHAPTDARGFELTIRSIAPEPQTVTITGNGRTLAAVTLEDHNWVTVRQLPPR